MARKPSWKPLNTVVALLYRSSPPRCPLEPTPEPEPAPEPEPEAEGEISAESGDYAAQFQAKFFGA